MSSNLGILVPLAIFTVGPASYAFTTWVRAKHGYPLETRRGRHSRFVTRDGDLDVNRQTELLKSENERLHGQVGRLEERIAVLERIATDPATRTAREIDALRD